VLTQPEFVQRYEGSCRHVLGRDARYAEAVAAVADAGYLPTDPASAPPFLLRSRQWERFTQQDPTGEQLYAFCARSLSRDPDPERTARILLDLVADADAPAAIWDAGRRALRSVGPGAVRDLLCRSPMNGDAAAAAVVVEAGHVPSDAALVAPLLYLTGQWERYDAVDPDGALLYAHCNQLDEHRRWSLRQAAERAGRPTPCPPPPPPRPKEPYQPGGSGTSGTGGYITVSW